jgi:diguanylate cyclase (GGDEF)-like protein
MTLTGPGCYIQPMPSYDDDKTSFIDSLLRQGIAKEEIDKLYRSLRDKGYGEEEARRRSRAALEKLKAQKDLDERRRTAAGAPPQGQRAAAQKTRERRKVRPAAQPASDRARRAVDWLPDVPPWLRRRINHYAYRRGLLITRLPERVNDFLAIFDTSRGDYVNPALLRALSRTNGYRGENPSQLSFADTLEALADGAQRLLGGRADPAGYRAAARAVTASRDKPAPIPADVQKSLRAREPFALEFFGLFTQPREMLRVSLEYLASDMRAGRRVPVADLARVVKEGCRLVTLTERIEPDRLERLFDIVRDVNTQYFPGPRAADDLMEAEALFRAAFQNLRRFGRELYPALLKMIVAFYPEEDTSPEKRAAILAFLGLREDEVLTWEGWQKRMKEQREKDLAEQQEKELARLEREKAEKFSVRFEGTLSTMASLFPDSGIERAEQGQHVLPYFANRIFGRSPTFRNRLPDLEKLSPSDIMGLVMVLHAFLDDLLSSVDPYALEELLGHEGAADQLVSLRQAWQDAYLRIFEPYLDEIHEYSREMEGDPRYAKLFRESERAWGIEERLNQLRNKAIRNFGHLLTTRERYEGVNIFELASQLTDLLEEAGTVVNQGLLTAADPVSRRHFEEIGTRGLVDFIAASQTGSPEYRAITRQVRRWIEARFRASVLEVPQKAQVAFMDVFRGVAELYEYLLNDPNSFAAHAGHGILLATPEDMEAWDHERVTRGRESPQVALLDEHPGRFLDALTGLQNKDFFLNELPRRLDQLRRERKPLALLMIDIDHFKWVNDTLGHPRGDEVLKAAAGLLLDNIREGDLAVRFGGEEMIVVAPADLHTGIVLAERLRVAQESRIQGSDSLADVRGIGAERGEPCGTFSVGVASVGAEVDLAKAVERVDKALYEAKRKRNVVVFVEPQKEKGAAEAYATYADYRRRAGGAARGAGGGAR